MKPKKKLRKLPFHPVSDIFQLMGQGQLDALTADIKANKQREAIWLHRDGSIIDGRNRHLACLKLKKKTRSKTYKGPDSGLLEFVVSLNLHRRHLSESQRAMVGGRVAQLEDGQRQVGKFADVPTQAQAAALVNVSERSVRHARKVIEDGADELIEAVEQDLVAVSEAAVATKMPKKEQARLVQAVKDGDTKTLIQAMRLKKRKEIAEKSLELPEGKYRVIYLDPPWKYGDNREGLEDYAQSAAEDHYSLMNVDELSVLPVEDLADENAVLFCWAVFPLLPDALEIVKTWGFKYKTAFVWAKGRPNLGNYHNASAELLLVCTRGSCVPDVTKREDQVQAIKREGRHSEKPEEFREMIDRLYTIGPRVELFRRGDAPEGWKVWGGEAV